MRAELDAYGAGLTDKREIVALSKVETVDPETLRKQADRLRRACGQAPLRFSSAMRTNVTETLRRLAGAIDVERLAGAPVEPAKAWTP